MPSPRRTFSAAAAALVLAAIAAAPAHAAPAFGDGSFSHVGTFSVPGNLKPTDPADTTTSSEIIDATTDGRTLIYTDSPTGRIGFVDATNPAAPKPKGSLDVGGEPTSVAVFGRYALVAVNTSPSFTAPSGELVVVDPAKGTIVTRFPLAGQPDSVAIAPSGRFAAIVIENERDEDTNDGLIPQLPAGTLQVLDLTKPVGKWAASLRSVDLTGLSTIAPSDPEPEFVDINRRDEAVVSLQENNHLAIVDLSKAKVTRHFTAGTVSLTGIDTTEEELGPQGQGLIELTGAFNERRREPDAVHWIDDNSFATANEGDYEDADGNEGGTRTVTIFSKQGQVQWDSGNSLEHELVRAGHFPQDRAENKGVEPEGLEVGTFGGKKYLFAGAERANATVVYELTRRGPQFAGVLPTGIGPEGLRAIERRGLFVVAAETDDPAAVRSIVTLYRYGRGPAAYPQLVSGNERSGLPIPWTAISGLSGDQADPNVLWAVSDSFLAQAFIYRIDLRRSPATIVQRIPVGGVGVTDQATGDFDLEGVVTRKEGGFWLASEGRVDAGSSRPNLIVRTDATGKVLQSVPLPAAVTAGATSSGLEGLTVTGTQRGGDEAVYVVLQREWKDDAKGFVKLGRYDVAKGEWTFVRYALDAVTSPAGGWVGLSELTLLPDGHSALIVERDNQLGANARIKRLYRVDLTAAGVTWKPAGQALDTLPKRLAVDVLPDLDAHSISVPDKLEGVGVSKNGRLFLATDNDGLDGNLGETEFFQLGRVR